MSLENPSNLAKTSEKEFLHKSGSSLGAISKQLKVTRVSVQNILSGYKNLGTTHTESFRKKEKIIPEGWANTGPKGSTEPQDNNKGAGEGVGGTTYQFI